MSNLNELLECSAVFGSIEASDLEGLETLFQKRKFSAGEVLMSEGDGAQYYYLLNSGSLLAAFEDGRALVLSAPGDFLGLDLVSDQGHCRSTVTVLEETETFAISMEDAKGLLADGNGTAQALKENWPAYLDQVAPFFETDHILESL